MLDTHERTFLSGCQAVLIDAEDANRAESFSFMRRALSSPNEEGRQLP